MKVGKWSINDNVMMEEVILIYILFPPVLNCLRLSSSEVTLKLKTGEFFLICHYEEERNI